MGVYDDLIDIDLLGRFWNQVKQHLPSGGDVSYFDDYDTTYWAIGTFSSANGTTATSTTRIRTEILPKTVRKVHPASGYKMALWVYNSSGVYQGVWNGAAAVKSVVVWFTEEVDLSDLPSGSQVRVLAADTNDSTITTSTQNTFAQGIIFTRYPDDSLSHGGYPADAAATGDMLAKTIVARGTLTSADDLDDITLPGTYYFSTTDGFPTHAPSGLTGTRIRLLAGGYVAGAWQLIIDNDGGLWTRGYNGFSSGSWSAWQKHPTSSEVQAMIEDAIDDLPVGSSGVAFITDELDENGGIVRYIDTDPENITDTVDEHGGIVRSITGVEVPLQVKEVTPGATEQNIEADPGYAALKRVKVAAASGSGMLTVEVVNGTADHTFEEIFNAVNGGTPVFLHIPAAGGDDWNDEYINRADLMLVQMVYKYGDMYRIAAASASGSSLNYDAAYGYVFAPAMYTMQASDIDDYPTFLRYVYPTASTVSVN